MSEEGRPVTELLLELLENPRAELTRELLAAIQKSIVEAEVPGGLEDVFRVNLAMRERLLSTLVEERLGAMLRGVCSEGVDSSICMFLRRLRAAYAALLEGSVIVDDAGNVYVRFRVTREYNGRLVPRGAIMAMNAGEAIILYAMGEVELASIKPLKAN